jgi:hypothetical protein
MSIITNENVIVIMNLLKELPNVDEVRTHFTLRPTLIEKYGANSVVFSAFIKPTNQDTVEYLRLFTIAPEELYNNVDYNMAIVSNMENRIESYYSNTEIDSNIKKIGVGAVLESSNVIFTSIKQ